ncbi:hypothetical protein [Leptolyngbya sp. FACHB-261]|uniref:hypothetical protein n=1 Tax=Leptolyngbya sp. FACHB-261 TaxID=2692806 RepID=UPI0016884F83|nr:hypothetical protein [Leptolyngbya sp. FACHB-261]MBD2100542.1 hypothetical protein [Leptolyngbya sp. FACHB-261]
MNQFQSERHAKPRNTAEWISLVISLLLLTGVIGTVIFLWAKPPQAPARFKVERGETRQELDQFYLPVTITNDGDATASEVMLEGKLTVAGQEETASTTFDFVPGNSQAEGVLIFSQEPTEAEVRVVSFQKP